MGNRIGNTLTIENRLPIESEKGIAELCIELVNQTVPPERPTAAKPHASGFGIAGSFK